MTVWAASVVGKVVQCGIVENPVDFRVAISPVSRSGVIVLITSQVMLGWLMVRGRNLLWVVV